MPNDQKFYPELERMYDSSPIHDFYRDIKLKVQEREAEVTLPMCTEFNHAANAVHGLSLL